MNSQKSSDYSNKLLPHYRESVGIRSFIRIKKKNNNLKKVKIYTIKNDK